MQLHRAQEKPDWEVVLPEHRNGWQRVAARTRGVITPANGITIVGCVIVLIGLWCLYIEAYWWSAFLFVIGRLFDVADGYVAELTKTKSPFGELLDAGVDKFITIGVVIALGILQLASWWLIGIIAVPQIVIAAISYRARRRKVHLHPSRLGKYSMALVWCGFSLLIMAVATDGQMAHAIGIGAYGVIVVAVAMSGYAAYVYACSKAE